MPFTLPFVGRHSTLEFFANQRICIREWHFLMSYCTTALIRQSSGQFPQAFHVFSKHSFFLLLAASLALSGCVTAAAVQVVGTAFNVVRESSGLKSGEKAASNAARELPIRLNAGEVVNATEDGESLALLVRVYQLRHDAAFARLAYFQAGQNEEEARVLGKDLIAVRELTLLPGKSVTLDENVPAEAKVIGVIALFRSPSQERWKMAFNTEASASEGISLGFHACSISLGSGVLTNPIAADAVRSLSGIRCKP